MRWPPAPRKIGWTDRSRLPEMPAPIRSARAHATPLRPYRATLVPVALLLAFVAGFTAGAIGQDRTQSFTVNGRSLRVPLPPDSCELDANVPRDRTLIAALEQLAASERHRSLRRFAPCAELTEWRSGRRNGVPDLTEIAYPAADAAAPDRAAWLKQRGAGWLSQSGEQLASTWSDQAPDLGPASGEARRSGGIQLDPERDERAVYEAVLARATVGGRPVMLAGVTAWTVVAEQPLALRSWTAWEGDGAIVTWLSEEQRDLVDRMLGANGEERRRFARAERAPQEERRDPEDRPRRDLMSRFAIELSIGLVVGGVLLMAVGMIGARMLRRRSA
jgi:hypothetical protein